jgi:hypothetical protein
MTDGLPTPRTTLGTGYVTLLVWCKAAASTRRRPICTASWRLGAVTCR